MKENDIVAIHAIVHSVAWAKVNPGFRNAIADRLRISEISGPKPGNPRVNRPFEVTIGDFRTPVAKWRSS
jgi:hypothetical protein